MPSFQKETPQKATKETSIEAKTVNPFIENRKMTEEQMRESDKRATEKVINILLSELLKHNAKKINEGNNGVIFRLDIRATTPQSLEILRELGLESGSEQAAKILKFAVPGTIDQEVEMQRYAYEAIQKEPKDKKIARVPKLASFRKVPVDEVLKSVLESQGIKIQGDEVEVIIMDLVKGDDLGTILYREIIKHHPSGEVFAREVENMDYSEMEKIVARLLQFDGAGGKARHAAERTFESLKVSRSNQLKVFQFLARSGLQLHPSIHGQLQAGVQALHVEGLAHRDLHFRNIMIEGDYRADAKEEPQVYMIDFGLSKKFTGEYTTDRLTDESGKGTHFVDDNQVVQDVKKYLSTSFFDQLSEERRSKNFEITKLLEKMKKNQARKAWLDSVLKAKNPVNLELEFSRAPGPKLESFLALALEAMDQKKVSTDELQHFLERKAQLVTPAEARTLNAFVSTLN